MSEAPSVLSVPGPPGSKKLKTAGPVGTVGNGNVEAKILWRAFFPRLQQAHLKSSSSFPFSKRLWKIAPAIFHRRGSFHRPPCRNERTFQFDTN